MKVARHFNAWNRPKNGPSRRARYDGVNTDTPFERRVCTGPETFGRQRAIDITGNHSDRTLRDGSFLSTIPGNKLPG
jgi:hypothetical protein